MVYKIVQFQFHQKITFNSKFEFVFANLVLSSNKDVKISNADTSKFKTLTFIRFKKLAKSFVCLGIFFDHVALDEVGLELNDLLLGSQALGVGCILDL